MTLWERGLFPEYQHIPARSKIPFLCDIIFVMISISIVGYLGINLILSYFNDIIERTEIVEITNTESNTLKVLLTCMYSYNCTLKGNYTYEPCSNLPTLDINFNINETVEVDICHTPLNNDGYTFYVSFMNLLLTPLSELPDDHDTLFTQIAKIEIEDGSNIINNVFQGLGNSHWSEKTSVSLASTRTIDEIEEVEYTNYDLVWGSQKGYISSCPSYVANPLVPSSCYGYQLNLPPKQEIKYRERKLSGIELFTNLFGLFGIAEATIFVAGVVRVFLKCDRRNRDIQTPVLQITASNDIEMGDFFDTTVEASALPGVPIKNDRKKRKKNRRNTLSS